MLFLVAFMLLMGLVDSLNPFTITVQILLLGTLKNVNRIAIYISGILVIYLVGGIAIFTGLSTIFNYLIEQSLSIQELVFYSIQLILGVILVVYGFIVLRKSNESKQLPNNPGVSTWALISLGAGVTLVADLPTAMPYFAFIAKMTEMRVDIIIGVTFLLAYSIIYVLPLIITWALYLKFQDKIKSRMAFVVANMEKVNKEIIVVFCVVGILLIINSVLFYVGIPIKW